MEFYLDLLYDFCRPGDWFLGIYTGSKSLVATKVRRFLSLVAMKVRRFLSVVGNGILP
jgi:hypothetical protein